MSRPDVLQYRRRASDALRTGAPEDAFAALEAAFAADARDPEVACDLATLALTHGEPASALDFARHALTLDATHAPSRAALALALAAEGDHVEALPLLDALRSAALPAGLRAALARTHAVLHGPARASHTA